MYKLSNGLLPEARNELYVKKNKMGGEYLSVRVSKCIFCIIEIITAY